MEASEEDWRRVVERQLDLQRLLKPLLPEQHRHDVTWQKVTPCSNDIDLKLGRALLTGIRWERLQTDQGKEAQEVFLHTWFPHLETQSYTISPVHSPAPQTTSHEAGNDTATDVTTATAVKDSKTQGRLLKTFKNVFRPSGNERSGMSAGHTVPTDLTNTTDITTCTITEDIKAQRRLLRSLQNMSSCSSNKPDKEVFVALSQVLCSKNSDKPIYSIVTDDNTASQDRPKPDNSDLLAITKDDGLLLGCVKSATAADPDNLKQSVTEAVRYLNQSRDRLRRLCKEEAEESVGNEPTVPSVRTTLILPNVTKEELRHFLLQCEEQLRQELWRCLEVTRNLIQHCLCCDDISDTSGKRVETWWAACLKREKGGDPAMKAAGLYRRLVTRFSIPLTTMELYFNTPPRLRLWASGMTSVITEQNKFCIALMPQQLRAFEDKPVGRDDVTVFVGPPGTGRTICLSLKGTQWLSDNSGTVFLVRTREWGGLSSAFWLHHQLTRTAKQRAVDRVVMLDYYKDKVASAREMAKYAARRKKILILIDDACSGVISDIYRKVKQSDVVVHLWAVVLSNSDLPADLAKIATVREFRQPLRSTPAVIREVGKASEIKGGSVPSYITTAFPVIAAPAVTTMTHGNMGTDIPGHQDFVPWRCEECGRQAANVLLDTLHVGDVTRGGMRHQDVVVVGEYIDCDTSDDDYHSPAPFIRGLQSRHIPTRGVGKSDSDGVREFAQMSGPDAVTVTGEINVWGCEREVVVYLGSSFDADVFGGRLHVMSRAKTHLVWFKYEV